MLVSHDSAGALFRPGTTGGHHQAGLLHFESDFMAGVFLDQQGLHIVHHHIVVKGGLYHVNQLFPVKVGPNGGSLSPVPHCTILLLCEWYLGDLFCWHLAYNRYNSIR